VLEQRWLNASVFDVTEHKDGVCIVSILMLNLQALKIIFTKVKDCLDIKFLREERIAAREFIRWDLRRTDCEVLKRFYLAPNCATTYWPAIF
jgi:hypothetical protein